MIYLGAHLSSAGGFCKMGRAALAIRANTLQCFVRNPRGKRAKAVDARDLAGLRELMAEHRFGPILAHAPYIMNPCSRDEGIRDLAAEMMAGDLALMEHLPAAGIELRLVPRLEHDSLPISATTVRQCIADKDFEKLEALVPPTTLDYIRKHF